MQEIRILHLLKKKHTCMVNSEPQAITYLIHLLYQAIIATILQLRIQKPFES